MKHADADTIAAVATPPGRGGVSIIRISGDKVRRIAEAVLGNLPAPRYATHSVFMNESGAIIDDGVAIFFPGPNSFTGEDVIELQGHGSPVVMDMLLNRVYSLGARPARPGEFSERAFLNDKLDLAQAEAIADLIDSHSEQAARSAMRSLHGEFSQMISALVNGLVELRVYIEAALDFAEEEIDYLANDDVTRRLDALQAQLASVISGARQGSLLREGAVVVIIGEPNVGKSTLLNRLAGREAAIVTEIPGTTRDVLMEDILLDGLPLRIIDTAGLRETDDPVELEGIRRARAELDTASLVLWIADRASRGAETQLIIKTPPVIEKNRPENVPVIKVWNKIDLVNEAAGMRDEEWFISAKTGAGVEVLRDSLKSRLGYHGDAEGVYMARRRHLTALAAAAEALQRASEQLHRDRAGELVAEELRRAQHALTEITGEFTADDLLGEIFSSFCIGK